MITETLNGKTLRRTFELTMPDGNKVTALDERQGIAPRYRSATGYGKKLPTSVEIKHDGRWRRVYTMIYSNIGTCYVMVKGKRVTVNDYWVAV